MRRLILGLAVLTAIFGLSSANAQASTLTFKEAKQAAFDYSMEMSDYFDWPLVVSIRDCSRLKPNRVRCSVKVKHETYWKLKSCDSRVQVTKRDEIKVRTIRKKCRLLDQQFLSYERAYKEAMKAMDPDATRYSTGGGSSSDGRKRYQIDAEWEVDGQACMQTARVRLVDGKVLVNVSEVSCVDIPAWPQARTS